MATCGVGIETIHAINKMKCREMASQRRFCTEKLIRPYPVSNEDCQCNEIHTPEGTYTLMHEFYQESTQPQFSTGTHVSFFCPTSIVAQQQTVDPYLGLPVHTPSVNSSASDLPSTNENWVVDEENESQHSLEFSSEPPKCIPRLQLHPPTEWHSLSDSQLYTLSSHAENPPNLKPAITVQPQQDPHTAPSGASLSSLFGHSKSHRKKPKTSLTKLKSGFIEHVSTHYEKGMHHVGSSIFFNVGLSLYWMDEHGEPKEPLSVLSFGRAYPTCQDVNQSTSSTKHVDVIIGFSSGDLVWYDTVSNRYSRINKNGILNGSSVTMVKWIPGSEDLFMASFQDGSMLILDKERDDQTFTIPEPRSWVEEQFQITKPNRYHSRHNPVAHWRVGQQGTTAFAFSPNQQFVATVGKDGLLRTIDYTNERLCDVHVGYYGRLLCVAWSPDGDYILTGGQDDLVSLWSFKENRIIARCQGHRSWVTGVAFDALHCDENKDFYRFASVGEDCKLLLWDFSVNALHKPKQKTRKLSLPNSPIATSPLIFKKERKGRRFLGKKRPSLFSSNNSSQDILQQQKQEPKGITQHVRLPTIHPAQSKSQVPFLQPIVKQTIHPDPCVEVVFRQDTIITTDRRGRVRAWGRPFTK